MPFFIEICHKTYDNKLCKNKQKRFVMIIRKFKTEDVVQILELCQEVRQHHIDILGGYFAEQNDEFEQQYFLETLNNNNVVSFVAEDSNKIVVYILGEFKDLPYLINSRIAHVSNFGVSKNYRSQGIGKQLMDAFYNICKERKIDEIRLGVYNVNTSAYKFYESYGFMPLEQKMIIDLTKK